LIFADHFSTKAAKLCRRAFSMRRSLAQPCVDKQRKKEALLFANTKQQKIFLTGPCRYQRHDPSE
jgi:hypothetical protein